MVGLNLLLHYNILTCFFFQPQGNDFTETLEFCVVKANMK